jgi:hypothetical protein
MDELDRLQLGEPSEQSDSEQENETARPSFRKPPGIVGEWLGGVPTASELQRPEELEVPEGLELAEDLDASGFLSEDEDESPLPDLKEYEEFISESHAYKWLLSKIEGHSQLESPGGNCLADIGDAIRTQMRSQQKLRTVSRQAAPASVEISFELDWSPREFIVAQEYGVAPENVLDNIICLTGTWKQAQAMTVAEYMAQTWPLTNEPLRVLLKRVLATPELTVRTCKLTWALKLKNTC